MPDANVTFHGPPGDDGGLVAASGILTDRPEARAALEQAAIPGCRPWRLENHEECKAATCEFGPDWHRHAAPYCCSAYCPRCAGLRALDGVEPLTPNQWMETL